MNDIKIFDYNGNGVTFRKGNSVMVNATEMAKPFGKRPNDFLSAKSTQELISSLSAKTGISATALVVVNQGGNNQGTWLHEDLALIFAQWLSPTFYLWCNDRIKELMQVGFTATPATLEEMIDNPDLVIGMATQLKQLRAENATKQRTIEAQKQTIELQAPKVAYVDEVLGSGSTFTATEIAAVYGKSAKWLNKILHGLGVQYRLGKMWHLYEKYKGKGYAKPHVCSYAATDSNSNTREQLEWTEKGRKFIHELLTSKNLVGGKEVTL